MSRPSDERPIPNVEAPAACRPGKALPLGATIIADGVRFCLFARHAERVTLCLFSDAEAEAPQREIELDPELNRTGDVWHVEVPGLAPGQLYLYRVAGPHDPRRGHRYDSDFYLLDPYARALEGKKPWRLQEQRPAARAAGPRDTEEGAAGSRDIEGGAAGAGARPSGHSAAGIPKCVAAPDSFDWQGVTCPRHSLQSTIIYETHVRGFTRSESSGVEHGGTYRGFIEKIPYLRDLGITAVELLPVHEFDEHENRNRNPETGAPLVNYWGYSTIGFFAPKGGYAAAPGAQVHEFKEMVRELHRAGIEVILDVVYNHTGEGNEHGPTISFRGIDNAVYYLLEEDRAHYANFTGVGNTLNCNHPVVRHFILDSLRYWVTEMHVDGFRFDLASVLARGQTGELLPDPPLLEAIAEDPVLRHAKIIAEAWDAAGAYQVGWFYGGRWCEWNDRYRDDVRRFWRGERGMSAAFATRISGSSDLYSAGGRKPFHSINYVTCHDGFTLADLVSYNRKHNRPNGEDNRDGHEPNFSYNYGHEGPSDDPVILAVRRRQQKNFIATLFLSLGTPMILGGDEFGRSQGGNNNAYCQDNETSWYDWTLTEANADLLRFTRLMIRFRRAHPALQRSDYYTGRDASTDLIPDITWFNDRGGHIDWTEPGNLIALRLDGAGEEIGHHSDDDDFYIMFNGTTRSRTFRLVEAPGGGPWRLIIDTYLEPPEDFREGEAVVPLADQRAYTLRSRSLAVLTAPRKG
ncbi:MAG: glycogen debranching protein GlgX [Spirochaetaceae bacterium]